MPYSGPLSAYATIGKVEAAYFKKINDEGGTNGRKIVFISLSPPKTVEMARRLVEQDEVLLTFNMLGTPTNTAVHKYMNAKNGPHLFLATGASKWNDPQKHILQTKPSAKVALFYQNDDFGKAYLKGFKDGLGDKAKTIIAEVTDEVSDPTVDSQVVQVQASGDVLVNFSTPKFAAQSIRRAYDIGWKPGALPDRRLGLGRCGADTRRGRQVHRPHFEHLWRSTVRTSTGMPSRAHGCRHSSSAATT